MLSLLYSSDNNFFRKKSSEMEAIDIEHDLVVVEEFDALSIEVGVAELEAKDDEGVKKYPAKQHARKVTKELGTDNGLIYLPGQLESTWEDSDQGPPFRQRRYFYYLTGADFPGCSVTYDIAADKLTLWVPFTPPATVLWFGNTPSPEDCLARSDVHDVKYIGEMAAYLGSRLATVKTLYALRASQLPKFDGFERIRSSLKIDVTSLRPAMDEARLVKSEYEIAMIRRANEVSSTAHKKVAALLRGMKNECEVEAAFLSACTAANARAQAYPVIVGSGPNASTLHYNSNNESLAGRQLVVLDAGAEWACYASEVTRTLPIGPKSKFTTEARAIYDLVHKMQDEVIQRIKPGVVFRDLQLHATMVAVKGLLELGILCGGTADEIFQNGTGAAFFPHGLGHHVGLDVHDVLSRDLLRPAGEGMWGKRRPIGPQSVRAMVKQAMKESVIPTPVPSSPTTSSSSTATSQQQPSTPPNSPPTKTTAPPLPPRPTPPPSPPPMEKTGVEARTEEVTIRVTSPSQPPSPPSSPTKGSPNRKNSTKDSSNTETAATASGNQPQGQSQPESSSQPTQPEQQQQPPKPPQKKGKRTPHTTLQTGMVVTVEPGVYFCKPYIEAYFLRRPEHANYLDAEALDRFWGVGGVRVEDCVLVTEAGCENLTTAPKGAELLKMMGFA